MAPGGWGSPTPPNGYPATVSEGDVPGRGLVGRFRSLFKRRDGVRTAKRRPDQMDIHRADGMYEVVPNRDSPMRVEPPSDEMAIYLDETYNPAIDADDRNPIFAIGGFITDDPEQVDRYGAEYPDMLLSGTPEGRREHIQKNRYKAQRRLYEEDLRDVPYKYSMLNLDRPLELQFRLNEVGEHLGGMYVAKIVRKNIDSGMEQQIDDGYGNMVANPLYPDVHDMYGAVLHDLLEDIQNQFPHTRFTLYVDPNTFVDDERLRMICRDFSTIRVGKVDERKKRGGLRYADMIVGASVERLKEQPRNDFASKMVSEHIINRNLETMDEGKIILSFIPTE